ncbi:hypothetical protein [Desertimonas flava]|uniref:hypothetical protein n=1 Tax=Desertimonas flava TaxID=2064846 RepID=UPI0013C50CE3|nr:hypothetical protein [Desertimonas flava]
MKRRWRARSIVIALAVLVGYQPTVQALAAEDSDHDGPADDDPRTDAEWAADQAAAETMVLTLADFPPGWESTPVEESEPDDRLDEQLAECLGVDVSELAPSNPDAQSPDFASSTGEVVSSTVAFAPTVADATAALAVRRQEGATECYAAAIRMLLVENLANPDDGEELPDDVDIGEPTVNEMSFEALGDETLAVRITVPFEVDGLSADYYFDVVNVRVGRVGVTTGFQSVLTPFDIDEAARLTGIVVDRVEAGAT